MNIKHASFKGKIFDANYDLLDKLYTLIEEDFETKELADISKQIEQINIDENNKKYLNNYRLSIYYLRICSLIERILDEVNDAKEVKNIVNYHLCSEGMKELNNLGLGGYYNVKFNKETATIYSSENIFNYKIPEGKISWVEWLKNTNIEDNKIKENILQLIMKGCREHINRGGDIKLISFSKCFGIDLFKYMYLDNDGKFYLSIVKNAEINTVCVDNKMLSVQEYLFSNTQADPNFCLNTSEVRNENKANFNSWFKNFTKEPFISEKELEENKNSNGSNIKDISELLYFSLLIDRANEGKTAISSRITPIKDREVIVSDDKFWDKTIYDDKLGKHEVKSETCYTFKFDEYEYIQLIYYYYFNLYHNKNKQKESESIKEYIEKFRKDMESWIDNLFKGVGKEIEMTQLKIENGGNINELNEDIDKWNKVKDTIKIIKSFIEDKAFYEKALPYCCPNNKIEVLMSLIDWEYERKNIKIIEELTLKNIFKDRNLEIDIFNENVSINILKKQVQENFGRYCDGK